jgi:uncharacterized membrane protein
MDFVKNFVVTGVIMGAFDAVWLSVIAKKFYRSQIGGLLLQNPNMLAALLFYIIYVIGIVLLVINPALDNNSLAHAVKYGAVFGLTAYATYDLTNLATLKGFTSTVVIVDLIWGTLLTATVAGLAFTVLNR